MSRNGVFLVCVFFALLDFVLFLNSDFHPYYCFRESGNTMVNLELKFHWQGHKPLGQILWYSAYHKTSICVLHASQLQYYSKFMSYGNSSIKANST